MEWWPIPCPLASRLHSVFSTDKRIFLTFPLPSTGTPVPTTSGSGIPVPPNALIQPAAAQPLTKDTLDSGFLNGISHVLIIRYGVASSCLQFVLQSH